VRGGFPLAAVLLVGSGCGSPASDFPTAAARTHVVHLGAAVGSRPTGTDANRRAREYLIETLERAGYTVAVQTADGTNERFGISGRVHNIIATSDGPRREAIALVAHYDSVPEGSGAADDAFGTAVVVEAARVLARRAGRQWSLMVLLTDAEEDGLLGASAVVADARVRDRVKVVLNVEAMGGSRPVLMFEAGPGNGWLTRTWARAAPAPRGAAGNARV
jgi:acetylornithine deacetylase/succinyl-diaminopimelate desuccinylase-like protein